MNTEALIIMLTVMITVTVIAISLIIKILKKK